MNAKAQYEKKRSIKPVSFNLESWEDYKALETAQNMDFSPWVKSKLMELTENKRDMVNAFLTKSGLENNYMARLGADTYAHEPERADDTLLQNADFAKGYWGMMGYTAAIKGGKA